LPPVSIMMKADSYKNSSQPRLYRKGEQVRQHTVR